MKQIPRIFAVLLGLLLAGPFAMRWLFAPESGSAELGISLSGPAAFSHMRGDTGGAFLAVGALAILGVTLREAGYLEAVGVIMAGIVVGRLYGIAIDGYQTQIGVALAVEVLTAVATLAAARQLRGAAR
jgi:hypothetical protein